MANRWADLVIRGSELGSALALGKAQNQLEALKFFGGAPSEDQAVQLKNVLGIDWPTHQVTPFKEQGVPFRPDYQEQRRIKIPGALDMAQQKLMIDATKANKLTQGDLTTDKVRAQLLHKQSQGLPLSEQESTVLETLNRNRAPFFTGQLDQGQMAQWGNIQAGLTPDANTQARLAAQAQALSQNLEFKNRQLEQLEQFRRDKLITDQQYRQERLRIDAIHNATTGQLMQAILSGEDIPEFDFQGLYGVDFSAPFGSMDPGPQRGGGSPDLRDIAIRASRVPQEQREAFLKEELTKAFKEVINMMNNL